MADHQYAHGGTEPKQDEPILPTGVVWIFQQQRLIVEKHGLRFLE